MDQHSSNFAERAIKETKHWSIFLPMYQIGQNAHFNSSLGMSPYEALTGRMLPIPIEIALGMSKEHESNLDEEGTQSNDMLVLNNQQKNKKWNYIMKSITLTGY